MADLHDALKSLGPVDWSDVPKENLAPYLQQLLEAGELICNSVPPPPGGDDFDSSEPAHTEPDTASSSKQITASSARNPLPHPSHAELQQLWGKPVKVSAKENPLGISLYKMAAKDRNGAWFARRSVHEGISFSRFRRAMRWEFAESLAVTGGPGAGNVRGIGGDNRLEKQQVEGVGQLEVYQLSAQFPGPTTPREFITMLLTSDESLSEKSTKDGANKHQLPRSYMVLSKPTTHPDAPQRNGYIRGYYESVELIREIPLHKKNSSPASTTESSEHEVADDHESNLNPVEWIMITRSDPGGGIPRFMVERGTPGSVCADASKFFDWACGKEEIPNPDHEGSLEDAKQNQEAQIPPATANVEAQRDATPAQVPAQPPPPAQGGIVSGLTSALDTYAPAGVASAARGYLQPQEPEAVPTNGVQEDDSSDSSSSYESADDFATAQGRSVDSLPLSEASGVETPKFGNSHDKDLQKIAVQQRKLNEKYEKKRADEGDKLRSMQEKDDSDEVKIKERHEKELKKIQEKHDKDMAKLETKREKELEKARKKRDKQFGRDALSKVTRERDDFRDRLQLVQKENDLVREQIQDLQAENTALMNRLSKLAGEDVAMQAIRADKEAAKRNRAGSGRSATSAASVKSSIRS